MAAKIMSSNDRFDFAQYQQANGLASPSDAKVFFSASDLSTDASNKKSSTFTRAHSLEIPDIDIDEDFPMVDLDMDLQDTSDVLNVYTFEDLWLPEVPNELENLRILGRSEDRDVTSNISTGRAKRISTKQKIDILHGEIKELTIHLQKLEYDALHQKKLDAQQESNEPLRPNHSHLWKQIASRQLEQRQQSEKENIKLRFMMETQIQEVRCLRRVLKHRKRIEMLETTVQAHWCNDHLGGEPMTKKLRVMANALSKHQHSNDARSKLHLPPSVHVHGYFSYMC